MQQILAESTIQTWAKGFVHSLRQNTGPAVPYTATLTTQRQTQFLDSYRQASKRLLLLDYDGVLAPFKIRPEDASPSRRLLNVLTALGKDSKTELVIISGRGKAALSEWFKAIPAAKVAEHGIFTQTKTAKNWQTTPHEAVAGWQNTIQPILEKYAALTPGALVEVKEEDLVWHYRKASPYYAQKYLVTLKRLLRPLAKKYNLQVQQGNKILEIRPLGVSKGISALAWYEKSNPDFVLAIGDDYTDEDMFTALPVDTLTIKVGRGRSAARYRLKNSDEVIDFLQKLSRN